MSENAVAEQEQAVEGFEYPVKVEEVGPAARRVTVEIPRDRIDSKLDEQYKELRTQAALPGFRVGHAPRKLLERRFSEDVKNQVVGALIQESYLHAIKKNELAVIGDPEFDSKEQIKLPDAGSLSYSFSVEVSPKINVPEFGGLTVKKPKITISEQNVDQAMANLREQQGMLVPVEDRGLEKGDYLTADVHVKTGGEVVGHYHDAQVVVRPGRVAGVQVDDLDTQLAGAKSGDKRSINIKGPDTHPDEKLRGKDLEVEFAVKDIKKLELAEINQTFLDDLGFENEGELRQALREQMEEKISFDIQQAMREQVNKYLLENTVVDLPYKLSTRQADRVIARRALDLQQRGVSREQISANIERLRTGAVDEAVRELKLFFILQKIAKDSEVDVSEGELNGRIAMIAAQREQRPEKVKNQMQQDGTMQELYIQMLEQKAIDKILEKVKIEEVEMTPQEGEKAAEPATASEEQK